MPPTIPDMPLPQDPTELIGYVATHNWYAIAAVVLMVGLQLVRKHAPEWWQKTGVGYRFLWPVVIAAVTGFVHGFIVGKPVNGALIEALNALWQIALPAMGGAAALKESPIPWDGGAGGVPKPKKPKASDLDSDQGDLDEDDRPTPIDPLPAGQRPTEPPPSA